MIAKGFARSKQDICLEDYSDSVYYPGLGSADDCQLRCKMAVTLFPESRIQCGLLLAYDASKEWSGYDLPYDYHYWLWDENRRVIIDSFLALDKVLHSHPEIPFSTPAASKCSVSVIRYKDFMGNEKSLSSRGLHDTLLKLKRTTDLIYIPGIFAMKRKNFDYSQVARDAAQVRTSD